MPPFCPQTHVPSFTSQQEVRAPCLRVGPLKARALSPVGLAEVCLVTYVALQLLPLSNPAFVMSLGVLIPRDFPVNFLHVNFHLKVFPTTCPETLIFVKYVSLKMSLCVTAYRVYNKLRFRKV